MSIAPLGCIFGSKPTQSRVEMSSCGVASCCGGFAGRVAAITIEEASIAWSQRPENERKKIHIVCAEGIAMQRLSVVCLGYALYDCGMCFAGETLRVPARDGQSIYEVALQNDVKIGDVYTCHVILSPDSYAAHDKPLYEVPTFLA